MSVRIHKFRHLAQLIVLAAMALSHAGPAAAQSTPDAVESFVPGLHAGFGAGYFPGNVLGVPQGSDSPQSPNFSQQEVLSLGTGGTITLRFDANRIIDQPGVDFTVFENPVQPLYDSNQTFADTAIVSVSSNGTDWVTFPCDMISSAPQQLVRKANYIGFAGVQPVLTSTTNGVSPYNPQVSGGDQFDLATIGVQSARFVRITDTGDYRHMPTYDAQNDVIYDYGYLLDPDPTLPGGGITAGFELDAMVAIHSEPIVSAVADWSFYE